MQRIGWGRQFVGASSPVPRMFQGFLKTSNLFHNLARLWSLDCQLIFVLCLTLILNLINSDTTVLPGLLYDESRFEEKISL